MKKGLSKFVYAFVFAVLGFFLINRYSHYFKQQAVTIDNTNHNQLNIISEIEQLKNEKESLDKDNTDIIKNIKAYESSVSESSASANALKQELERNRMLLGITDVKGPGIILYVAPKSEIFKAHELMDSTDLAYLVNELFSASAEAVSINDSRITPQTTIDMESNIALKVNEKVVRADELITIKAIGNAELMRKDLENYNTLKWRNLEYYKVTIEDSEDIAITRYTGKLSTEGLKENSVK